MLCDLYVRGKYRDVILPMTVLRRLASLLEPSKPAVLEMKTTLDHPIEGLTASGPSGKWAVDAPAAVGMSRTLVGQLAARRLT